MNKKYNDYITEARSWKEDEIGYNYRMSTMNARFLYHKIDNFKKVLEEKTKLLKNMTNIFVIVQLRAK